MLRAFAVLVSLHTAPATDSIPGAWRITGDVSGTAVNTVCTIKQAGTVLSGSCTNDPTGSVPLTGEMKDGKITFQYVVDYQGQALTVVYSGTLASPAQIKGTIDVNPMGVSGTFSAVPVATKP